jgi:hypothetical protein
MKPTNRPPRKLLVQRLQSAAQGVSDRPHEIVATELEALTSFWVLFYTFSQTKDGGNMLATAIICAAFCGLGGTAVLLLTVILHLVLIAR